MKPLSKRQSQAYDFIAERLAATGVSPTLREIRDHLGIKSIGTIGNLLKTLADKGAIVQGGYRVRGTRIKRPSTGRQIKPMESIGVPEIDRLEEGKPLLYAGNVIGYISFDRSLVGSHEVFCFRTLEGDCPEPDMKPGDMAVVSLRHKPGPDDLVAAAAQGAFPLKVITAQEAHGKEFQILGKVIGLFRRLAN